MVCYLMRLYRLIILYSSSTIILLRSNRSMKPYLHSYEVDTVFKDFIDYILYAVASGTE